MFPRDICSPKRIFLVKRVSPTRKDISLLIYVPLTWKHTPLVICVSRVGGHRSQGICVSQVTGGQFVCACVNIVCTALSVEVSANCLRSLQAFAGCFLKLNDVFWELRSTNVFLKVSRYFYDESELLVGALLPLRGQSFFLS